MKKISLILIILAIIFCGITRFSFAQTPIPNAGGGTNPPPAGGGTNRASGSFSTLQNPLKATSVTGVLLAVVDLAIVIGVVVAVLMFIFIGFKFVLAQGNDTKLKEAKEWFLYAIIGTAILISSKLIVEVVQNTLISAGVVNENLLKK